MKTRKPVKTDALMNKTIPRSTIERTQRRSESPAIFHSSGRVPVASSGAWGITIVGKTSTVVLQLPYISIYNHA
jgi:hypothetical protein